LNKILKDIINRYHVSLGRKVQCVLLRILGSSINSQPLMLATFLVGTATDFQLKTKLCKNLECVLGLYFFTRALNCAQKERLSFHSSPRNPFCRQCNCSERNCIAKGPIPSTWHHGGLEFGVNISHIRYVNLPIARFVQIRSQCTRNTSNISDHKYEIRQLRIFQKMVDKGMPKSSLFCAPC